VSLLWIFVELFFLLYIHESGAEYARLTTFAKYVDACSPQHWLALSQRNFGLPVLSVHSAVMIGNSLYLCRYSGKNCCGICRTEL